jgi:hypothetical protein
VADISPQIAAYRDKASTFLSQAAAQRTRAEDLNRNADQLEAAALALGAAADQLDQLQGGGLA